MLCGKHFAKWDISPGSREKYESFWVCLVVVVVLDWSFLFYFAFCFLLLFFFNIEDFAHQYPKTKMKRSWNTAAHFKRKPWFAWSQLFWKWNTCEHSIHFKVFRENLARIASGGCHGFPFCAQSLRSSERFRKFSAFVLGWAPLMKHIFELPGIFYLLCVALNMGGLC